MKKLTMKQKSNLTGYLFVLPFVIGFLLIYLSALILYVTLSFKFTYASTGGMVMENVGWDNYYKTLFVDSGFIGNVLLNLRDIFITCPAILLYSFFIATLLNTKFKGMTLSRALFFLPVVVASGFAGMQNDSLLTNSISLFTGVSGDGTTINITKSLLDLIGAGMDSSINSLIEELISQIYVIIMSSGVQIIIFLAALQTIPKALYEASSIEGSSSWEDFWKITLPMISPMIIVSAVYTIIDRMAGTDNTIMNTIYDAGMVQGKLGEAAAMGIIYLLLVFIILGLVIMICNRFVFYEDK